MRNRLFSLACLLLLFGPLLYASAASFLPWIRTSPINVEAEYLTGEKAISTIQLPTSLDGFLSKKTQKHIEQYIDWCVPAKATTMLATSSLQRDAISLSNKLFGFACYPTFFGSDVLYLPEYEGLMRCPNDTVEQTKRGLAEFCDGLDSWAQNHLDIQIWLVMADISEHSSLNPAVSYMNPGFSTDEAVEYLKSWLHDLNNVRFGYEPCESLDEYFSQYYLTDHHWNGFGAARAYMSLGRGSKLSEGLSQCTAGIRNNGSLARSGLDLLDEPVAEPALDVSGLEPRADYDALLLSNKSGVPNVNPLQLEFNFYHEWYGPSANCEIKNHDITGANACVVGDSYSSAFQWLVARDFSQVSTYLDMHGSHKGNETLDERLDDSNAKVVCFVGCVTAFADFLQSNPNYFN